MSTRLEHFPNELILDIFGYFDVPNLHYSFWGINQRFNNLLRSLENLSLTIEEKNEVLIEIFARQIRQLQIQTFQVIDLSQFSNLHLLELLKPTDRQIEQIQSDIMPNLMHLTISTECHISLPSELIEQIFTNDFRFLRHASLPRLNAFAIPSTYQSHSLHSLRFTFNDPNVLSQILLACPNLLCLNVICLGENRPILSSLSTSNDHSLERFSLHDPYHNLSFNTIQTVLTYIPNVKYLFLQFLCRGPIINLMEKIPDRLERFECDILECRNDQMVNVEVIQQMNECFQYVQCIEEDDGSRVFLSE